MSEEKYIYPLSKLLEYSDGGDFEKTGEIVFDPPNMDNFNETEAFNQIMMRAMISASESMPKNQVRDQDDEKSKVPKASEIRMILYVSQVDIQKITQKFKSVLTKSAYVAEGKRVKDGHISKMEPKDLIDMMCGYAAFFTFPSIFSEG